MTSPSDQRVSAERARPHSSLQPPVDARTVPNQVASGLRSLALDPPVPASPLALDPASPAVSSTGPQELPPSMLSCFVATVPTAAGMGAAMIWSTADGSGRYGEWSTFLGPANRDAAELFVAHRAALKAHELGMELALFTDCDFVVGVGNLGWRSPRFVRLVRLLRCSLLPLKNLRHFVLERVTASTRGRALRERVKSLAQGVSSMNGAPLDIDFAQALLPADTTEVPAPPGPGPHLQAPPESLPVHVGVHVWLDGRTPLEKVSQEIDSAYAETLRWRTNQFRLPSGAAAARYVRATSTLVAAMTNRSPMQTIAAKALQVLPHLVLQRTHRRMSRQDCVAAMSVKLDQWDHGDILLMLQTAAKLQRAAPSWPAATDARAFGDRMRAGHLQHALSMLEDTGADGASRRLPLSTHVAALLREKYPPPATPLEEAYLSGAVPRPDPSVFTAIHADSIRAAAARAQGSAGPSGVNAKAFCRMLHSYGRDSEELCSALAALARTLCTTLLPLDTIQPFVAARAVALAKSSSAQDLNPETCENLRPLSISQIHCRVICSAIHTALKPEVSQALGTLNLAGGQPGGSEAVIQGLSRIAEEPDFQALLIFDGTNSYQLLNRKTGLHNIRYTQPSMATALLNLHQTGILLCLEGQQPFQACEGTLQGLPLATDWYCLAMQPLFQRLLRDHPSVKGVLFADNGYVSGPPTALMDFYLELSRIGPSYGFVPKPKDTRVLTMPLQLAATRSAFQAFPSATVLDITDSGLPVLGAFLTKSAAARATFVETKVASFDRQLDALARFAHTEPHAAHAAFTHGLSARWNPVQRLLPDCGPAFLPLQNTITTRLIPALLTDAQLSQSPLLHRILSLGCSAGGLDLVNPVANAPGNFSASAAANRNTVLRIATPQHDIPLSLPELRADRSRARVIRAEQRKIMAAQLKIQISQELPHVQCVLDDIASSPGSSAWLQSLPLVEHGFYLSAQEFTDATCLRYLGVPPGLPARCDCAPQPDFSLAHSQMCPFGGMVVRRHDVTVECLAADMRAAGCTEVLTSKDIVLVPTNGERFTPATAVGDKAKPDIRCYNFWSRNSLSYFEVKIVHPFATSNRALSLAEIFAAEESFKFDKYEQRIRYLEPGGSSLTPLVWSTTGIASPKANMVVKVLASKLSSAARQNANFSTTLALLRCRIGFGLVKASCRGLRGHGHSAGPYQVDHAVSAVAIAAEAMLPVD